MSLGDNIRRFFSKKRNPDLSRLEEWVAVHRGVEGYIEPQTSTNPTTLLLVDRSGDHLRGPVREPADAVAFCERVGIPVYDASVIGYPRRMRDFERHQSVSEDLDAEIAELERLLRETPPDSSND
ncbi:MAG: oxidoreductase [Actinomycetota bacterium]